MSANERSSAPDWLRAKMVPDYANTADGLRARAQRAEAEVERLRANSREVATLTIVMLAGLEEMWAELPLEERVARAEGELRGLLDRLDGAS